MTINSFLQVRYGGKSVIVKANDRPNCAKHPDIVDLTTTAFRTLAPLSSGKLAGSFIALDKTPKGLVKEFIPTDFFANYSIKLDANIPNIYLPNETLKLSGKTTGSENETLVYLQMPSGKTLTLGQDNLSGNRFEYYFPLTEIGTYQFVVASGRSFAGARSLMFTVLDPKVLAKKYYEGNVAAVNGITVSGRRVETGDLTPTNLVSVN